MSQNQKQKSGNPFASLEALRASLPKGEPAVAAASKAEKPKGPERAVVQYERKGHGGKEATRITHLCGSTDEAERWAKQLKQKLGCGGHADGRDVVLQGDQRKRLPEVLGAAGVQKVTVS